MGAGTNVPEPVATLASKQEAARQSQPDSANDGAPPQVIVATQPTELIETTGPAEYAPVEGTDLLYVSNTDSDVFMDIDTQSLYVLLAGRWFTRRHADWSMDLCAAEQSAGGLRAHFPPACRSRTSSRACPARKPPKTPCSTRRCRKRPPSSATRRRRR